MRDLEKDIAICESRLHKEPVKWQKFGDSYYFTGQYGLRPIVLGTLKNRRTGGIMLSNRRPEDDRLIPLDPNHPDSVFIEEAWEALPYWLTQLKQLQADLIEIAKNTDCTANETYEAHKFIAGFAAKSRAQFDEAMGPCRCGKCLAQRALNRLALP